jgi:hypothetical protein
MTEDIDLPDGPFTLRELDALGITRAQLRRLLDENVAPGSAARRVVQFASATRSPCLLKGRSACAQRSVQN